MPGIGDSPNLAQWIARAINEGASQRATMATAREAGFTFSDSRFRSVWHAVTDSARRSAEIEQLSPFRRPPESLFTPWSYGRPDEYVYSVSIFVRDTASGVIIEMPSRMHYGRIVSPQKAINDIMARATEGIEGSPDYPGLEVQGVQLTGLYKTVDDTEEVA